MEECATWCQIGTLRSELWVTLSCAQWGSNDAVGAKEKIYSDDGGVPLKKGWEEGESPPEWRRCLLVVVLYQPVVGKTLVLGLYPTCF